MLFEENTKKGVIILLNRSAFDRNMINMHAYCFELIKILEKNERNANTLQNYFIGFSFFLKVKTDFISTRFIC